MYVSTLADALDNVNNYPSDSQQCGRSQHKSGPTTDSLTRLPSTRYVTEVYIARACDLSLEGL